MTPAERKVIEAARRLRAGCKVCGGKGYVESVEHVTPCIACIPGWPDDPWMLDALAIESDAQALLRRSE